jgi:hypothetical protein
MDTYLNTIELIMAERMFHSFGSMSFPARKSIMLLQHEFYAALKIVQKKGEAIQPNPEKQALLSAQRVYNVLTYGDPAPSCWKKMLNNFF